MSEGDRSSTPDGAGKRKRTESSGSDVGIPSWIAGASPPRFLGLEELLNAARGLDNMALAHEIAINSEFKLEARAGEDGSLEQRVSDIMHNVFWEKLTADLDANPPDYSNAMSLLAELRENLLGLLLPHHTRLKAEIEERLDLELLKQECQHNCLEFQPLADYVLSVMGKLCAPIRDDKMAELRKCKELIPLFRGIFETLDAMKLDMANFTIASYRPVIQKNSAEYERQQFQKFLDANPGGLRHTESWLRRGMETWRWDRNGGSRASKIASPDSPGPSSSSVPNSHTQILTAAYWELLEWSDNRAFPETLLVDQARLYDMRNRCLQLIVATSAVMVSSNLAGRSVSDSAGFRNQLKDKLLVLLENCEQRSLRERLVAIGEEGVKAVMEAQKDLQLASWDGASREALRTQLLELSLINHPVRKLIRDRIRSFVMSVVESASASPVKLPPGLSLVQSEIAKLTGSFLRLVAHNRQVFAEYYDRILDGQLVQDNQLPASSGDEVEKDADSDQNRP